MSTLDHEILEQTESQITQPVSPSSLPVSASRGPVLTGDPNPEISRLIQEARTAPASFLAALACSSATGLMLYAAFFPLNMGYLAWIALVPLLALARIPRPTRGMYTASFLGGLTFYLPALQWMRLGDVSMYVAWGALAIYCALSFPIFLRLTRVSIHRLHWPLVISAPLIWTALEYVRAHLMTGFSWYYLAHTQFQWLEIIQVADLVGTYGLSFVIVAANVAILTLLPKSIYQSWCLLSVTSQTQERSPFLAHQAPWKTFGFAVTLVAATYAYGKLRLQHDPFPVGPRIALIQGNFVASLTPANNHQQVLFTYEDLSAQSVVYHPDLIIWPEAMFRYPLLEPNGISSEQTLRDIAPFFPTEYWSDTSTKKHLQEIADRTGAAAIIGINCYQATPDQLESFNSAVMIKPQTGLNARYDKIHLVPFGEYLPLYEHLPLLQKLTPLAADFGLDPGHSAVSFNYEGFRYAPVICFEDSVPHLVRDILLATKLPDDKLTLKDPVTQQETSYRPDVDCLVNLSNDGWFHGSSEHDQHLVCALFRCVENRVPLARAANMGISAFIDGDGHIIEPETFLDGDMDYDGPMREQMKDPQTGRFHRALDAALVTPIPLDPRSSFYLQFGDWFAQTNLIAMLLVGVSAILPRFRKVE